MTLMPFQNPSDQLWLLLCSLLVMLQQGGFLCLEAGITRKKNSINVAAKNLTDAGLTLLGFWLVGYAVAFNETGLGINGARVMFTPDQPIAYGHFIFHALFCCTAITIVSGAVAERCRYQGYIALSILGAVFAYPILCNLAWSKQGVLREIGFYDFAGGTVVHSYAGWVALAAIMVIGPRQGRFASDGKPIPIPNSDLVLATLGTVIVWVGWLGFNGGSLASFNAQVFVVVVNTLLAGAAGFAVMLFVQMYRFNRVDIPRCLTALLAGLVAVTAGADMLSPLGAIIIASIGVVVMCCIDALLLRHQIDDPLNVVPVHLGGGAVGTLVLPFVPGSDVSLYAQCVGVVAAALIGFIPTYLLMHVLKPYVTFRCSPQAQAQGLNAVEHGARDEYTQVLTEMQTLAQTDELTPLTVEPFTEVGVIAGQFNALIETVESQRREIELAKRRAQSTLESVEQFSNMLSAHTMLSTTDVRGKITHVNDAFAEMSGYSKEELLCSSHRLLKSQEHDDAFWQRLWETVSGGETWSGALCNRKKLGELYWVQATISPSYKEKKLIGYISTQTVLDTRGEEEACEVSDETVAADENSAQSRVENRTENSDDQRSVEHHEAGAACADGPIREGQSLRGFRCLVVEDTPFNQEIASMLLQELGLPFDIAENGLLGVEAVEKGAYDIVLMDLLMPVMDGLEATRKIRERYSQADLPIIAMTANALVEHKKLCDDAGMNDFISKPVDFTEFKSMLLKWLNK